MGCSDTRPMGVKLADDAADGVLHHCQDYLIKGICDAYWDALHTDGYYTISPAERGDNGQLKKAGATDELISEIIEADPLARRVEYLSKNCKKVSWLAGPKNLQKNIEMVKKLGEIGREANYAIPTLKEMIEIYGGSERGSYHSNLALAVVDACGKIGGGGILLTTMWNGTYNIDVRKEAVRSLGVLAEHKDKIKHHLKLYYVIAIPQLMNMLVNSSEFVDLASDVLAKFGKPATGGLTELLGNKDSVVRSRALRTLGKMGNNAIDVANHVGQRMLDKTEDKGVRVAAAKAMGNIGFGENAVALLALSKVAVDVSLEDNLRFQAELSLRDIIRKYKSSVIIGSLIVSEVSEKDERIIVRALDGITKNENIAQSERIKATKLLGKLHTKEAIQSLFELVKKEIKHLRVRRSAPEALGKIGSPEEVSETLIIPAEIIAVINDRSNSVYARAKAVKELGNLGSSNEVYGNFVTPKLIEIMENKYEQHKLIRRYAAAALGKIGSEKAILALTKALEDPEIAKAASKALNPGPKLDTSTVTGLN